MEKLQLDYLDLYLIHWPAIKSQFENWKEINRDTWRALEKLYKEGRIKAIGVSNFLPHHLEALMENAEIKPMVNQIEFHPGFIQPESIQFCKEHDILPLPKSVTESRIIENAQVFDFDIAQEDIKVIDEIPFCGGAGINPDEIKF